MIENKFAGICENCEEPVAVGAGFVSLIGDDWIVRCSTCTLSSSVVPPLVRTGKCVVCQLSKRPHLINANGICVDCA